MIDKCSIVDIRAELHKHTHFDKPGNRQQEETIFTTTESAACVLPARWLCQVNIKKSGQQDVMEDVATFMAVHTHAPERILPPNTPPPPPPRTQTPSRQVIEQLASSCNEEWEEDSLQNMFKKKEESEVYLPITSPVILQLFRSWVFLSARLEIRGENKAIYVSVCLCVCPLGYVKILVCISVANVVSSAGRMSISCNLWTV